MNGWPVQPRAAALQDETIAMKLLFRLFGVLAGPTSRPPQEPGDTCITRWRVLPSDVDLFGHMNNSRYQAIMDLGRIDYLRRCDLLKGVVRNRWIAPVGSAHLQFRKQLAPLERYELHTTLMHWDERWFYFRQQFFRRGDRVRPVCTGYVTTLFVGREGPVPTAHVVPELSGRELAPPPLTDELRYAFHLEMSAIALANGRAESPSPQPPCLPSGAPSTANRQPGAVAR
ncbi:MAG: acyl-CoA thioesterase [Holophagales bacterium]|nr:MAG: acyl-CoA thioesterase [Holophagales bacterium]